MRLIASQEVLSRESAGIFTRFTAVGVVKSVADFAVFNIFLLILGMNSPVSLLLANTAGFASGVLTGYMLNARFTFRAEMHNGAFVRYIVVSIIGLMVYNLGLMGITLILGPSGALALNAAKAIALISSAISNFIGYSLIVFDVRRPQLSQNAPLAQASIPVPAFNESARRELP